MKRLVALMSLSLGPLQVAKAAKRQNVPMKKEAAEVFNLLCSESSREHMGFFCEGRQGSAVYMESFESLVLFTSLKELFSLNKQEHSLKDMNPLERDAYTTLFNIQDTTYKGWVKKGVNYGGRWWQIKGVNNLYQAHKAVQTPDYLFSAHNRQGQPIVWIQCGHNPTWALNRWELAACSLVVKKRIHDHLLDDVIDMSNGSVAYIRDPEEQLQWYRALFMFTSLESLGLRKNPGLISRMVVDDNRLVFVSQNQKAVISCEHPQIPNAECLVRVGTN